jgi:Cu/Zn superoxide dismutase
MLHAMTDDYGLGGNLTSLENGNSGMRIACGIIAYALPPNVTSGYPY